MMRVIVKSLPGIAPIPGPLADLGFNSPFGIVLWTIGLGTSVRLLCAFSTGAGFEPDGPLIFSILASTFCVIRLAYASKPSAEILLWVQAGLCLGLAMLAKYYAVLLPIGIALFALTSREHRQWFRKPGPYIACAIALAVFSPVLLWNFQNDWIS